VAVPKKQNAKGGGLGLTIAILVCAGIGAGAYVFKDRIFVPEQEQTKKTAHPWYKEHATKAPQMIHLPDTPLILAAKDVEIDPTIKELKPQKPLKIKKNIQPQPRLAAIDLEIKPTPPTAYEEALPQDVYTPVIPSRIIAQAKMANKPTLVLRDKPRWMKFALDVAPVPTDKPLIALVIDDLGLDRKRTARILALAGPMTMAFIPYSKKLSKQTQVARDNGHELLLHLPMEPLNPKVDAGPNHLNTHLAPEDLLDRIHWNLERFEGYVGVNNHMGSRASADNDVMTALMKELRKREMLFLDSRTNPKSIGAKIATLEGVPFAERNVFIDNVNEKDAVLKQLSLLERVSKRSGFAVGIGHPRDGTIAALKEWLPLVQNKGFVLVPISQIVMKNQNLS